MCGIVGIVGTGPTDAARVASRMCDVLHHRGPDDGGIESLDAGTAIGMRRLSILDHAGGRQPMWDGKRRMCVVFNGEIYNAPDLRRELVAAGHQFRTSHSDTEVLLHGFQQWKDGLFAKLNGMFALAIWDAASKSVTLARDRFGEKPLYYSRMAGECIFASELKAVLAHPRLTPQVDPHSLRSYLAFDFVPAPMTLLAGVQKLPAGHYATVTSSDVTLKRYWAISFSPTTISLDDARSELDRLLEDSVRNRVVADVPVGLFLSGGLDSSTIGYYMTRCTQRVNAFTIGFDDAAFDESEYACTVARHLGIDHHVERLTEEKALELIPALPDILDEPIGDPSILPTYLLSRFTRSHVTVALGGDGSDELLMGYPTYRLLQMSARLDAASSQAVAWTSALARSLPEQIGAVRLKGLPYAQRLDDPMPTRVLTYLSAFHGDGQGLLTPHLRSLGPRANPPEANGASRRSALEEAVAGYVNGYLQEEILVKVDRASMATSLEVRSPFLDYPLADFFNRLPVGLKLHRSRRKYVLASLMRGRIPDHIIDRPKSGFGIPLDRWMRTTLAPLVAEYLAPPRLRRQGFFDDAAVSRLIDDHRTGRRRGGRRLWLLLQFQLWHARWIDGAG
jgi:asparagine synthase (glutamine-hydrolysing)